MSKPKIDHAAEALKLTGTTVNGSPEWVLVQHLGNQIAANTYATLALAEQQRIGNLIAYYSLIQRDGIIGGGPGSSGALDDIFEGLGL